MTVSTDLDRRFREAAGRDGLLDVRYELHDSPVGTLLVAVSERGLCGISYDPARELDRLARDFGARVLRVPNAADDARRQLDEYFGLRRQRFDLALDLSASHTFARDVLVELGRVPFGETTTYGTLAARVGKPRAARAVGTVMNRNPLPIVLPCHRVIGATGALTGYAGGLDRKRLLLSMEGALPPERPRLQGA
jgi:methylated-DNA-[protein]-cysteine S-methyltransferase